MRFNIQIYHISLEIISYDACFLQMEYDILEYCEPRILAHALPLDSKLDFWFENDFIYYKMT